MILKNGCFREIRSKFFLTIIQYLCYNINIERDKKSLSSKSSLLFMEPVKIFLTGPTFIWYNIMVKKEVICIQDHCIIILIFQILDLEIQSIK